MVIFIAAGGTGGHIIPAVAVADSLRAKQPGCTVIFIGSGRELEKKLIPAAGYQLETVPLLPFSGNGLTGKLRLAASLPAAAAAVKALFRQYRPAAIAGFGGYPSFLPVLVSAWLKVPRVINEQNVKAGIANRVLSLFADAGFAVPGAYGFFSPKKIVFASNPVRSRFFELPVWSVRAGGEPLRLLIVGGSQGALSLNTALIESRELFSEINIQVTHQTGRRDLERVSTAYKGLTNCRAVSFIDDMAGAYGEADLVISRAGAMSAAELSAAGRAAIFVPLPIAGAHQAENAAPLVRAGGALLLEQDSQLAGRLKTLIRELCADQGRIAQMAAKIRGCSLQGGVRSADLVADKILQLALARTA